MPSARSSRSPLVCFVVYCAIITLIEPSIAVLNGWCASDAELCTTLGPASLPSTLVSGGLLAVVVVFLLRVYLVQYAAHTVMRAAIAVLPLVVVVMIWILVPLGLIAFGDYGAGVGALGTTLAVLVVVVWAHLRGEPVLRVIVGRGLLAASRRLGRRMLHELRLEPRH